MSELLLKIKWHFISGYRAFLIKLLISVSAIILISDTIYKSYYGITYQTRENCFIYSSVPKWMFLIYEYLIELFIVVLMGIVVARIIEKYILKVNKFLPRNSLSAFLYASLIPVCSCSVIPLIQTLMEKTPPRAMFTLIVAAPLLNPYIIMVSVTVLGLEYAILRVLTSLILAVSTGYVLEYFFNRHKTKEVNFGKNCIIDGGCPLVRKDIFLDSFNMLKKVLPFIILAGILSIIVEVLFHSNLIDSIIIENKLMQKGLVILVGVPVYFCNGADVLFLKPFIKFSGLSMGTSIAFSLTSTSVCITSLVMLIKYIGKKLTSILLTWVILATLLLSFLIDAIL